jgi:hypothetical protein
MLEIADEERLRSEYPALVRSPDGVVGVIAFTATYDQLSNQFQVVPDGSVKAAGDMTLSVQFAVRIEERRDKPISALPAVFVGGVDPIDDRHFSQVDKSACLCSPLEEGEFLEPKFNLAYFIERLVVPFLYGQAFYTQHGRWPWTEYSHGSVGLLEAYSNIHEPARATECLRLLSQDGKAWPKVKAALQQKPHIKGHTPCFCPKRDNIRRCHPNAWRGALQLQLDVRTLAISIP